MRYARVLAAAAALTVATVVVPAAPASAHFQTCSGGYIHWSGGYTYYSRPGTWPLALLNGIENAAYYYRNQTHMSYFLTSSGGGVPWSGSYNGINGNPASTVTYWSGCSITSAPISMNLSYTSIWTQDDEQSNAVHEMGHASGQARTNGTSDINDGCSLRTIMQQQHSCRWNTMGIKTLGESHDQYDYGIVYP